MEEFSIDFAEKVLSRRLKIRCVDREMHDLCVKAMSTCITILNGDKWYPEKTPGALWCRHTENLIYIA